MTRRRGQAKAADSRQVLDAMVSESQLQRDVIKLAQELGWLVHHVYDSRLAAGGKRKNGQRSIDRGFPDLILAKTGRVSIAVELKTERGHLSMEQRQWLAVLAGSFDVYIWRPRDWSSGEIERVLIGRDGQRAA